MEKLHFLCAITAFLQCVSGAIKFKPANISCTTGLVKGSVSYTIVALPGCSEKYLPPVVSCSDIPAGPVNYTGGCSGNTFQYVWRARDDAGGSYTFLKGFKMKFYVQDGRQFPYLLNDCYFVHVMPPVQPKVNNRIQGQFSLRCFYHGSRRLFLISILSSYPTPEDCYGDQENPKWKAINLTVPAPDILTSVALTTHLLVPATSGVKDTGDFPTKALYGFLAAGVTCIMAVILLVCFVRRRKLQAGTSTAMANNILNPTFIHTEDSVPTQPPEHPSEDQLSERSFSGLFDTQAVQQTEDITSPGLQCALRTEVPANSFLFPSSSKGASPGISNEFSKNSISYHFDTEDAYLQNQYDVHLNMQTPECSQTSSCAKNLLFQNTHFSNYSNDSQLSDQTLNMQTQNFSEIPDHKCWRHQRQNNMEMYTFAQQRHPLSEKYRKEIEDTNSDSYSDLAFL